MDQVVRELQPYMARFGRRLRLRDGWLLAQRSLWVAALGAALTQFAGRLWPLEGHRLWTLAPLVVWILAVTGISLVRSLPPERVARRLDAELGLKERLATALALEGWEDGRVGNATSLSPPPSIQSPSRRAFQPSLVALQRRDALDFARSIRPRCALPLGWLRHPLLLAGALTVAAITLVVLPNPMDGVLAERAAVAQTAEEQAEQIDNLREEIENAQDLTPEAREELLRQLAQLAEQLRANPGDRQEALANLSRLEEALRQQLDPGADARQAALQALAKQLQALPESQGEEEAELFDTSRALEKLAQNLAGMGATERESAAQALAQMAARVAQAGDRDLAQALAALAQAAQSGDSPAAVQAAQAAGEALAQAQGDLADQAALRQTLSQLSASRQAIAQAGQGQALAQGQGQGQGQGRGQGQPGGGGGTRADTLPPASSVGKADRPVGAGQPGATGELEPQIYVPWERRQGSGGELSITGQDTGEGETQVRERNEPLPGAAGQALVPYHAVYYDYLDAANQTLGRDYVPSGLKDYVREYFSQLEP